MAAPIEPQFEIVTNTGGKSKVWSNFGFVKEGNSIDRKRVACRKCRFVLKYSGNTTNLFDHWQRKHGLEPLISKVSKEKNSVQSTLDMTCVKTNKLSSKSDRSQKISMAILEFIIKDLRPFSVVQNTGFKNLMQVLDPRYTLPSRKFFSDTALPKLYDQIKDKVLLDLNNAEYVALTTDGWTSRATESYITITSSHVDSNWTLRNFVLQTRAMPDSHTGTNIATVLKDAVKEWQIKKASCLVTDNAENMVVAAKEADFEIHIGCFAHTLNLACGKVLKLAAVSKLLAKIRRIVSYFHRSTTAAAILKLKQDLLTLPKHKLIMDCQTRWNSAVDMTARYLEQQPAIIAALSSKELRGKCTESSLHDQEIIHAEELMSVLQPLKTATVALCEEKIPTLSIVLPLQVQLTKNILGQREEDTPFVRQMKLAIKDDLVPRYEKVQHHLMKATLLDPRFKSAPFSSAEDVLNAYQEMTLEAVKMVDEKQDIQVKKEPIELPVLPAMPELTLSDENPDEEESHGLSQPSSPEVKRCKVEVPDDTTPPPMNPVRKQSDSNAMSVLFGDIFIVKVEEAKPSLEKVEDEITKYRKLESIPLTHNPLTWWREHAWEFPVLEVLARKYLSIPEAYTKI